MAGRIELVISADASNAIKTLKATQANINKLEKTLPNIEKSFVTSNSAKDLEKLNSQLSEVLSLIDRAASAVSKANPSISELQAKYDILTASIESLGREYGGLNSASIEYLKNIQQQIKAQLDLENATKKSAKSQSWFKKQMETVKNVMSFRVIMKVVNYIASFTKFLSDANKAAAESEQVFSKLNTVFGETSGAMAEAVQLASEIGVATSTAASALSTVGDLLQAQGKTTISSLSMASEWVSQFQDIIAFKDINMTLEEFAQNFMSGAAGNLRNFRTFGSIVRESAVNAELAKKGLDKLTGSELELAKMTTRAEMALEQQKNAIGATQREWDTMLSINRRYEESLKTFKEATGEQMKPITRMWVSLKTYILDVLNAEKKLNDYKASVASGTKIEAEIPLFGGNFDEKTYLKYRKEMVSELRQASREFARYGNEEDTANTLTAIARKYGASQSDLNKILQQEKAMGTAGFRLSDAFMKIASSAVDANDALVEQNETLRKIQEATVDYANSIDSLMESMQSIRNVSFAGEDWYQSFTEELDKALNGEVDTTALEDKTSIALSKAIENAVNDIKDMSSTVPEVIFSEDAIEDILNTRIDAYKDLYDMAYSSGKFEQKQLELIVQGWKDAKSALEEYNKEKDRDEELKNNVISGYGVINYSDVLEMQTKYKNLSTDGAETERLNAVYRLEALYQEALEKAAEIGDSNLESILNEKKLEELFNISKYYDNKEKYDKAISFIENKETSKANAKDYVKRINYIGMDEVTQAIAEYDYQIEELSKQFKSGTEEGDAYNKYLQENIDAIKKEKEAYINLTDAQKKYNEEQQRQQTLQDAKDRISSEFNSSLGETGILFSSLGSITDIAAGGGDLLSMLISITSQTEAFARASSLLSDTLGPVLNAALYPIVDLLDELSPLLKILFIESLEPLYNIIYSVADALTIALKPALELATDFISYFGDIAESVIKPFLPTLYMLGETLGSLFEMVKPFLSLFMNVLGIFNGFSYIMEVLSPILKIVNDALEAFEVLFITVFTTIEVVFKNIAGNIELAILNMWNGIVDMLRDINILGWRPFSDMGYADTTKAQEWANLNLNTEVNKKLEGIQKTLGSIEYSSLEIADNTSDKDFDTYKKLLLAKEIDQKTYNKWTGMDRYTTQSLANGVSYTTGNRSYVNVNNLTVQVPEGMTLAEFLKGIDDYNNGHGLYSVNTLVS